MTSLERMLRRARRRATADLAIHRAGWGLVASLVYQFIVYPFLIATILVLDPGFPVERLPVLDWKELGALLLGMLGLG